MYRVLRKITIADGQVLKVGDIVDAHDWKNRQALVNTGRLEALVDSNTVVTSGYAQTIDFNTLDEPALTTTKKRGRPKRVEA